MSTTPAQIGAWFDAGVRLGDEYMIVMCDTFSWEDYPVYYNAKDCLKRVAKPGDMQTVMEVYDLKADKASQLLERRAMHLPPKGAK